MAVHSGKFGRINGKGAVGEWTINDNLTFDKNRASNLRGGTQSIAGVKSWGGSYNAQGGQPGVMPGESFSFAGFTAPDDGTSDDDGLGYSGTAYVASVVVTWDWATGVPLKHTVNFAGHLALTETTANVGDTTTAAYAPVQVCSINKWADPTLTPITNVKTAVLTITNALQAYANSSTVVSNVLWTGQTPGPTDATLSLTRDDNERTLLVPGTSYYMRLYTSATAFWDLEWMTPENYTGIVVSPQSGAIIGHTVNMGMVALSGGALGSIVLPDTTTYWPVAA